MSKLISLIVLSILLVATPSMAVVTQENVQSTATHIEGPVLSLTGYVVPEDGVLVVRNGVRGFEPISVTFDGVEMIELESFQTNYNVALTVGFYYLDVTAGDVGDIVVTYLSNGTDQKAITASTLVGMDSFGENVLTSANGPNLALGTIFGEDLVLSAAMMYGSGIPEERFHVLDSYDTVPETLFHEMKFQTGSLEMLVPNTNVTLGYENTRETGYMEHAMILVSVPEPDVSLATAVALLAVIGIARRRSPQG
jgi:hypothetical protein